jgi:signal transduction histidine kinase
MPSSSGTSAPDPLLAVVCHDLRAPLASVTMGASYVLGSLPDDEPNTRKKRILEAMLRSCSRMERLVRNFADLSQIEGDAVPLVLGPHDAGALVEVAREAAADAAEARGVQLRIERPEAPLTATFDRERIQRALGQLVDNAVEHAASSVEIVASRRGHLVELRVTDDGPGVPPEIREHMFDRRWLATRAGRAGTGLGLAIARGFAEAHGGSVEVGRTGGRTSVSLVLPVAGR